jgi:hypothetical protein
MRQRPDRFFVVLFVPFRSPRTSCIFARPLCTPVLISDTECYTLEIGPRLLAYTHLHPFERTAEGLLDDEDIRQVQLLLNGNPHAGVVVPGTGGLRKLRIRASGRGKRGGGRVVYLYVEARSRIYLMAVFPKNQLPDITAAGYRALKQLATELKKER